MRMTESEYLELMAKRGQTPKLTPAIESTLEPTKAKSRAEEAWNSLETAKISLHHEPGLRFGAGFDGARVLSLNELLRIDMRLLNKYRKVWHAKALLACQMAFGPRVIPFNSVVRVTLIRRGRNLVDNDGLAASFKFAIDGFKEAGLIADDNPTIVETIRLDQAKGPYAAALLFEAADAAEAPQLVNQLIARIDK